jgi:hypothetical protein
MAERRCSEILHLEKISSTDDLTTTRREAGSQTADTWATKADQVAGYGPVGSAR